MDSANHFLVVGSVKNETDYGNRGDWSTLHTQFYIVCAK